MDKTAKGYEMTQASIMTKPIDKKRVEAIASAINLATSKRIDDLRVAQRITKAEMGRFLGISFPCIRSKLIGESAFQFNEVVRIANWWHLSLDELIDGMPTGIEQKEGEGDA